ncbi:DUF3488 and transglutaminase-like domain-containing protein [Microbacterium dauci]|uniref:DUF3488 and transglutaminase-like domain-containing protein n=1 Tax=Microbacterium dauci TaxID=3048008 RepID=A0ABT6ZFB4_9MICO|nr:DUF3488 and transglutaminase-like domain-containing protein [Microbacterium sp. LX3-4]MDJ1114851.1 DUF3488 and transglutaminase-like domain-containing protein [Microbacterium sp. LX3-4]
MSGESRTSARPRHDGGSTIALLVAIVAALLPLVTVISPGLWTLLSITGAAALLIAGYLARRFGLPAVGVTALQAVLWVGGTTAVFFSDAAWLLVIPTVEAIERVPLLVEDASTAIAVGVAPLDATPSLSFLIVAAIGLLTIALDHVVLTARMPLLATVALVAVWLIPSLAVRRSVDVWAFVVLAAAMLWLIRAETRSRTSALAAKTRTRVGAVSATIAVAAIVISVVAAPNLPPSVAGGGAVGGTSIDASLELGDDLRRPSETPVVRTWGEAPTPPYLRIATLTRLDSSSWVPDRGRTVPLDSWTADVPEAGEDIRVREDTTNVEVLDLSSTTLPIPYPATSFDGLGDEWIVAPDNLTVRSAATPARGQQFKVVTTKPLPTLEQARAAEAGLGGASVAGATSLPAPLPPIIRELAAEVTADATTDYDRLLALQSWFRGTSFEYSLETPVEAGFDGSGADAVGAFLEARSGYCVHYASAFALMARTLGMPSRVVVGFLPGNPTGETRDDERVYEATTAQLHAWPEVHFEGIGWVAFEPTKSLGTAQRFNAESVDPGDPTPSASPSPTASASPQTSAPPRDPEDGASSGAATGGFDFRGILPVLAWTLGALALVAAPGVTRIARDAARARRAAAGSVAAAWRLVQDAAIDHGIEVRAAESPRAFGRRLSVAFGAPRASMDRLVKAVELSSYAAPGTPASESAERLRADAAAVRDALREGASGRTRFLALATPRSLLIRPGSTFASAEQVSAP